MKSEFKYTAFKISWHDGFFWYVTCLQSPVVQLDTNVLLWRYFVDIIKVYYQFALSNGDYPR